MCKKEDNYMILQPKSRINRNKIILVVMILIIIVCLIFITKNIIDMSNNYKVYKEYEKQLSILKEEQKKKQEEIEKKRQEKLPKLTNAGRSNIDNIYKSEIKRAFLTFDDGPSSNTSDILDILKQENVPATFFVLGTNVDKYPQTVKRIYEEGHYIANHGYSHIYSSIYQSPQSVLDEYNQCEDSVKKAIGENEYNSHLFRFPGGLVGGKYAEIKRQANQLLNENDILHIDWNALNGDAETGNPTIEFEMQRLQETVGNKNSVVILMHDAQAKKATAEALPQIIQYLEDNGYQLKNFYEIIK